MSAVILSHFKIGNYCWVKFRVVYKRANNFFPKMYSCFLYNCLVLKSYWIEKSLRDWQLRRLTENPLNFFTQYNIFSVVRIQYKLLPSHIIEMETARSSMTFPYKSDPFSPDEVFSLLVKRNIFDLQWIITFSFQTTCLVDVDPSYWSQQLCWW